MKYKVYEKYKNAIKTIECDKCKHEFNLSAVEIQKTKIELNNTIVDLVYFTCPKCNTIYRVSIQDARYYDLQKDLENIRKRIRRNKGKNNIEFARVLGKMADAKLERLQNHVKLVNSMFPGTFTFVTSENNNKEKIIKYLP